MKRYNTLALLTATALGIAASATAAPRNNPDVLAVRSEAVHYDASEINDGRAAQHLFSRIRKAADDVCWVSSYPRGYEIWLERDCAVSAVQEAVRDANLPALDDYYLRISGRRADSPR